MKFLVAPQKAPPLQPYSDQYRLYLNSQAWRVKREQVIIRAGKRCEHCGDKSGPFQVHHRHYRTLGKEKLDDLACLCGPCHEVADTLRKQWSAH